MLTVYTDLKNTNWLEYILEEFKRIQNANFDIVVSSLGTEIKTPYIYYIHKPASEKGPIIFNCNQFFWFA